MLESISGQSNGRTTVTLVDNLQDQVQFLRKQLERAREGSAERRRIIAAKTQPIPEMKQPTETLSEMRGKNKPYSELGKLLDAVARSRNVRGPYYIALHVKSAAGHNVSGQAVSKYLYGEYLPKCAFIEAFADAFELTLQERTELAWTYTYGFRLPHWIRS